VTDEKPSRRREDYGRIPDWAKFSTAVIGGCALALVWVEGRFVTRVEWASHLEAQKLALAGVVATQQEYATAEKATAAQLAAMNVKLTVIDTRQQIVLERLGPAVIPIPIPVKR